MKKGAWYVGGAAALLIVIVAIILLSGGSEPALAAEGKLYKSMSCGCCGVWASYADREGFDLEHVAVEDTDAVKDELGVPAKLRSCHTTVIDDYFIEGHVPAEAIAKLLAERPDIKGIALPGMPSGSPGMPGSKQGTWVIYAVQKDGSVTEFMRM